MASAAATATATVGGHFSAKHEQEEEEVKASTFYLCLESFVKKNNANWIELEAEKRRQALEAEAAEAAAESATKRDSLSQLSQDFLKQKSGGVSEASRKQDAVRVASALVNIGLVDESDFDDSQDVSEKSLDKEKEKKLKMMTASASASATSSKLESTSSLPVLVDAEEDVVDLDEKKKKQAKQPPLSGMTSTEAMLAAVEADLELEEFVMIEQEEAEQQATQPPLTQDMTSTEINDMIDDALDTMLDFEEIEIEVDEEAQED